MLWLRRAAARGSATAMVDIGDLYTGGMGVPRDCARAIGWYKMAAARGNGFENTLAMEKIGDLYSSGFDGVPKSYRRAEMWYRRAASAGDAAARKSLAKLKAEGH